MVLGRPLVPTPLPMVGVFRSGTDSNLREESPASDKLGVGSTNNDELQEEGTASGKVFFGVIDGNDLWER